MTQQHSTGRYAKLFTRLEANQEGAFVPFVVLGDPGFEASYNILVTLIENGADALELGIPFSDPLADGPEIQTAVLRAFAGGINVEKSFELIRRIRQNYPNIPIGLLMYSNLVQKNGIDHFYRRAEVAGVDSVLVADAPLREYAEFMKAAEAHNIDPIFICPPNATLETLEKIAELGAGYTYLVTRAGVTGVDQALTTDVAMRVNELTKVGAPPAIQGFGISTPEQAAFYIQSGVKGVISGSAIVRIIRENLTDEAVRISKLGEFVRTMKAATKFKQSA